MIVSRWARGARLSFVVALLALGAGCGRPTEPAGDLRVAFQYEVASLDPHLDDSFEASEQTSNIYEPLVDLDRNQLLVPALADAWSDRDATTWSFHLRPGVRFHDGSPLTAEDVVYSVMRLKTDETLTMRSQLSGVTGAAVENGRVVLRTGRPSARLLHDLSQVFIVRAGSTREGLEAHPNGTGPYAVESWTPRRRLVLRRHEAYWGPRPAHPRVVIEMGVDEQAAAALLREGRLSVGRFRETSAENAASQSSRYRLVRHESLYVRALGFNLASPTLPGGTGLPNPFLRREVRQAIDFALDRVRIAAAVSEYAVPAFHIFPRSVFGHDPGAPVSSRDIVKARRLLETAGYPNGFDVALHDVVASPNPVADEVKAQLAEIGIRVTLVATPQTPEFFAALRRREFAFWSIGLGCSTGEAGELLSTYFHSPDPVQGLGLDNDGGVADRDLDRAIEEADAILRPSDRLPALQRAVRLAENNLSYIPLLQSKRLFIVDRALVFEPRNDLQLRYADIGSQGR